MTDFAKVLTDSPLMKGSHGSPADGACVMEKVAILWALHKGLDVSATFSDLPECTNAFVARNAQAVNDLCSDEARQRLNVMIPRLLRARRTESDHRINTRLAVWAARRVLHLVEKKDKAKAVAAIEAAEAWLDDPCERTMTAAYAAADAATAYAAAYAAYAAANANAAAAATAYAAYATAYAAYAAAGAGDDWLISFLDELLDAWEEAVKEEDQDLWVAREWEDEALAFVSDYMHSSAPTEGQA